MDKLNQKQGALPLRGQTGIQEIIKHFNILKNENKHVLSGWITVKQSDQTGDADNAAESIDDQLNIDRYTNHFQELKTQNRCSLFVLYDPIKVGAHSGSQV